MKFQDRINCILTVAVIAAIALPARALAESWAPTPLPQIAANPVTGYPGHGGGVPANWKPYNTDEHADSESCQLALNDALHKVGLALYEIPPSTTDEQHAYARAADAVIKANGAALQALRPICLQKPPPNAPVVMTFPPSQSKRIETFDPRYAPLKLLCAGYSECTVRGKVIIDCISGRCPAKRTIGSGSFSLRSAAERALRVPLSRAAQALLKQRGSLNVRVTVRSNGIDGNGPPHTLRLTKTLKYKKR